MWRLLSCFPTKKDSHINVKVEFGKGKGKAPLKTISERAEAYKSKESSKCGREIETAEKASDTRKSRSNQRCIETL